MSRSREERGQTLVLACLLVGLLAAAVFATAHVAHQIHRRIALQNAADASAYSLATLEARAFNFYAFANRAQVSHYVSAMNWQATNSFVYFVEAWLTDFYGFFLTLQPLGSCASPAGAFWQTACTAMAAVPWAGTLLQFVSVAGAVFRSAVTALQHQLTPEPMNPGAGPDRDLGELVTAHRSLNMLLAGASTAVGESVLSHVVAGAEDVVRSYDPAFLPGTRGARMGALSACLFDRAHLREANGSPLAPALATRALDPFARGEASKVARAKRVMAQISNGTRYACAGGEGCDPTFVTGRRGALLSLPPFLGGLEDVARKMGAKWGQTRFLSRGASQIAPSGATLESNLLRDTSTGLAGVHIGETAAGDALGSDDGYEMGLSFLPERMLGVENPLHCPPERPAEKCWGEPGRRSEGRDFRQTRETSIWATHESETARPGGLHYRVMRPGNAADAGRANPERWAGLDLVRVPLVPGVSALDVYVANVEPVLDGNHDWPGLVPFSHFEPGHFAEVCPGSEVPKRGGEAAALRGAARSADFNQPSVWQQLEAAPSTVLPRIPFLGHPPAERMRAISRAQTYYHRPGNGAEQPNFFNPYWRTRLAPVVQGLGNTPFGSTLLESLPGPVRRAPQQFITH